MAPPISRAATARRMPASRPAIIVFRRLTFLEEPFPAQKVARHAAQLIAPSARLTRRAANGNLIWTSRRGRYWHCSTDFEFST
jgi:hypothetical protein